jgi:hypothetical protein
VENQNGIYMRGRPELVSSDSSSSDEEFVEMYFLLLILQLSLQHLLIMFQQQGNLLQEHILEQRRLNRLLPMEKQRPTWAHFSSLLSDRVFQRMFRMPCQVFNKLCERLIEKIGEPAFKSERYLREEYQAQTKDANEYTGGIIPGEIKVAMTIRILAGASYLDMILQYYVSPSSVFQVFHDVIQWIDEAFQFPLFGLLKNRNWDALHDIAMNFAKFLDGVFYGCIGALDGIAIRIRCPFLSEDSDPGSYFCRKKFYALNVQVIVDANK